MDKQQQRRTNIRRLLSSVLRSDAEFEAFCLDYFPLTGKQFSAGMDRQQKINLLLQNTESDVLLAVLKKNFPREINEHLNAREIDEFIQRPYLFNKSLWIGIVIGIMFTILTSLLLTFVRGKQTRDDPWKVPVMHNVLPKN